MKRTINNKKRFKQPLLFEGTERGNICFTDIDAVQEIDNHTFIIVESKVKDNSLTTGQRLLMERLCDKEWKNSIAIVVEHNVPIDKDVMLKDIIVRKYRLRKDAWKTVVDNQMKFLDFYDGLCERWGVKKLLVKELL